MNKEDQINKSESKSKEDLLDFLLQEKRDRELKAEWSKKYSGVLTDKKVIPLKVKLKRYIAVAASLLVLAMVVFNIKSDIQDPVLMAAKLTQTIEIESNILTRGSSKNAKDSEKIGAAISEGDYNEAFKLLGDIEGEQSVEMKYLNAVVLVKSEDNDSDEILELTSQILETDNQYRAEALWISALTKIKLKKFDSAKTDLNDLLAYSYKTKEIKKLLKSISLKKE